MLFIWFYVCFVICDNFLMVFVWFGVGFVFGFGFGEFVFDTLVVVVGVVGGG